jgi:hypothetical protein
MGRNIVVINRHTADRVGRAVALSEIEHPLVRKAYDLWNEQRGGRKFATPESMPPRLMSTFLRNIMLIGVIENGEDFEFRIMGDGALVAFGQSFQGMHIKDLNELEPGFGDVIKQACGYLVSTRTFLAVKGKLTRSDVDWDTHDGIFLPLGPESDVTQILYVGGFGHGRSEHA